MRFALTLCVIVGTCASMVALPTRHCPAAELSDSEGVSSREVRQQAARGVPLHKLHPSISQEVQAVLENPSYFRRMPTQQIDCDPQMFSFLVRRPEVLVNIWEVMGITKVTAKRTSPNSFIADDGVGTICKCDLVYSDNNLHIYMGGGSYEGTMAPRKVSGRCVSLLRTVEQPQRNGQAVIVGTMDVFLKVDNFGADLLTRSIGPFVGKTADYNFIETAKFVSQISQVCQSNPSAAQALAMRLDRIDDSTRREFAEIVTRIASASADRDYQLQLSQVEPEPNSLTARQTVQPPQTLQISPSWNAAAEPAYDSLANQPAVVREDYRRQDMSRQDASRPGYSGQDDAGLATPAAIAPRKSNIFMRR